MKKLFLAALFLPLMLASAAFAQYSGPQTGLRDPVATGGCVWLGIPGCPLVTSSAGGGGGAITVADGADVNDGSTADAVYSGTGSATVNGILKGIWNRNNALLGYYKTEDAVHGSGDNGIMALAVRQPNPYSASTSSASGDYDSLHTTPTGELFVAKSDGAPITVTPLSATGVLFTTDTLGWDSISFQLTGTWVGSVVFEVSDDNTTWYSTNVYGVLGGATSSTTNVNSIYSYVAQHRYFRARVSVWTSGTIGAVALLRTGPPGGYSTVTLGSAAALASGTAIIGQVINASWFSDTTAVLAGAATYTGATRDLGATATTVQWSFFGATFFADQAGTAFVEYSNNNSTWYLATPGVAVTASTPVDIKVPIRARYYRVRYLNGATLQGQFNINSSFTAN